MEIRIPLPLDNDYLRRQCPNCEREFKWHHGPTEDRPIDAVDPPFYYCPYCGQPANPDAWWTHQQVGFATASAAAPALAEIEQALGDIGKDLKGGLISFEVKTSTSAPPPPEPLFEPDDMTVVASPCHPWEPVKVSDDWNASLFCLICGDSYAAA